MARQQRHSDLLAHEIPGRPGDGNDTGSTAVGVSTGADGGSAGEALSSYLRTQATAFLRGLGLRGEDEAAADSLMRGSARRIAGALHTYGELTDPGWAEPIRAELGWLGATLGREPQYAVRLGRLLDALRRLSVLIPPEDLPPRAALPAPAIGSPDVTGRAPLRVPDSGSPPGPAPAPGADLGPGGRRNHVPTTDPAPGTGAGAGADFTPAAGPAPGSGSGPAAAPTRDLAPAPGTGLPPGPRTETRTETRTAPATGGVLGATQPGEGGRASATRPGAAAVATRGGGRGGAPGGVLTVGAARAAALLERQLTLARTRAHSATLQAMGSGRFHALADSIAVLASEVPMTARAGVAAATVLPPLAAQAHARLAEAAGTLPLRRAGHPYNAEAVQAALGAELTSDLQDAPWHQVRILLRLSRYAAEVPGAGGHGDPRLAEAALVLQRHHEAAESAAAVSAAARTPRIAPATAYALGVLHADQRHEVEAARFAFSRLWQA